MPNACNTRLLPVARPDQTTEPVPALGNLMVPSWASGLAPCLVESRVVALAGGATAVLEYSRGEEAGMVMANVPNAVGLSAESLRVGVQAVFELVLGTLRDAGFPHTARMWAFVPGIHDRIAEGMDRYRVFNMGRYDAFARWFGGPAAFATVLPAASAVGHTGDHLVVSLLGLRTPGVPLENPRQTPAFGYSRAHGPRPPCFARAMVARLPMGTRLLVSGTASIRCEDSVHAGSLASQLEETFENLDRLVQSVQGTDRFSLGGVEHARVYFSRATDRVSLIAGVSGRLPSTATVEYVPAWICRPELLVEIEAIVATSPA